MATKVREAYISVSADKEAKELGESTKVLVRFEFDGFTEEDLLDRLMVSNSPKVSVQSVLRNLKEIPQKYTYKVPKAGTRATLTPEQIIDNASDEQLEAIYARLQARRAKIKETGSNEEAE
jgi:pyrrolidone-carboxylate peptidase